MQLNIVFMGSPDFSLPTLQALSDHFQVQGVVTQPDRPAGRGKSLSAPPVKKLAIDLGLDIYQPRSLRTEESFQQIKEWNPDVIVVAAFGQILKKNILTFPPYGCVNVHASLLPRWRGASPINAAILNGDQQTGVTIMKMDEGLDTGPIISMRSTAIDPQENAGELSDKLAQLGGEAIVETLPKYISGDLTPIPQNDEDSTYAPMLSKKDGELDFSKDAEYLARQVRAYSPWPGTFTYWKNQPLKIHRAKASLSSQREPSIRTIHNSLPAIYSGNGLLILEEVQPAGKRKMSGETFLNGARDWITE